MSINTYAVNCNDAWLNTEVDDISGSYVKYKDHQEVVAALEAKCAALAAENAGLKRNIEGTAEFCYSELPETPATDAFLAEVRAQGVEMFGDHLRKKGSNPIVCKMIALGADEFAAQLRQEAAQ